MRGATGVILHHHQILRLPRKMFLMIDPCHETSLTLRGATGVTLQRHHILCLPRKMPLMMDACHIWNVIYNARSNRCHTKYCACHEKCFSSLILVTCETSFTMGGATGVILQRHQILRLPWKMILMTDPLHTWNASYNAASTRCHPPTSPDTVPATKKWPSKIWATFCWKQLKRHLQCAADHEHDLTMIWLWTRQSATRRTTEVTLGAYQAHFVWKNTTFRAPATIPNFTKYCACHEKWQLNFTKNCACHEKSQWTSPNSAPATKSHSWTSPKTAPATKSHSELHQIVRLPRKVTVELHQILRLLRQVTVELHQILRLPRRVILELRQIVHLPRKVRIQLLLCWTITWLNYYRTELVLDWAVSFLLYGTTTWLNYYLTDYYFTKLLRHWTMTWLNCYFPTLLNQYLTEPLLDGQLLY